MMTTCFGLIILIFMLITNLGNPMLTVTLKLLRMIFIFLKFLKLSFSFFSVMREITEVCYHFFYNLLVSLTNMRHFLIIIIGNKNFQILPNILSISLIQMHGFRCMNLNHLVTLFATIQPVLFLSVQSQELTLIN